MKRIMFLAFVAVLMMAAACSEPLNEAAEELSPQNEGAETPKMSHWGNKIEDPYSVSNMRLAFKELMKSSEGSLSKAGVTEAQIVPTHLHLKFIPKNEKELDLLEADSVLAVVPIPFNYDLENFDGVYRDPECPADQPTYQYSVVRIGHELPKVEYEVLDSLFILDGIESEFNGLSKTTSTKKFWVALEYEAMKLTDNLADYTPETLSKKYRPYGKVTFEMNGKTIPVPDAKVHVNFSTHHSYAFTKADGSFQVSGHFRKKVHYHVYFKNAHVNVYDGHNRSDDAASYGGRIDGKCDDFFINDVYKKAFGTLMKVYYDYNNSYFETTKDLGRTFKVSVFNSKYEKYCYVTYANDSESANMININDQYVHKYDSLYSMAVEAYAGLILLNSGATKILHNEIDSKLKESWLLGMKHYVMQDSFPHFQYANKNKRGLIIDLVDDDRSASDYVHGMSMATIEQKLKRSYKNTNISQQWNTFAENLKIGKSASEKNNIDILFNYWKNK